MQFVSHNEECQNIPWKNSHILEVGGTFTAYGWSSVEDAADKKISVLHITGLGRF